METRPTIVCLCGSTKFKYTYRHIEAKEELAGNIVLSIGSFEPLTSEQQVFVDALHIERIKLCDEILVIDVDEYVGDSTTRAIGYATDLNKRIRFWSYEIKGIKPYWKETNPEKQTEEEYVETNMSRYLIALMNKDELMTDSLPIFAFSEDEAIKVYTELHDIPKGYYVKCIKRENTNAKSLRDKQ